MTTTDQTTTTDVAILGVTIPADLVARAIQSTAEVRAIAGDALPVLERARAVLEEAQALERLVEGQVRVAVPDGPSCSEAMNAAASLAYALAGAGPLHTAMLNLAGAADPDSVSAC